MGYFADLNIATCETILQGIAENGGATVTVDGAQVPDPHRYIVALGHEYETIIHPDAPEFAATVLDYVNDAPELIARATVYGDMQPPTYIGAWVNPDTGLVHLDLVQAIGSYAVAVRLGRARGQLAIFDTATGSDISLTPAATV